MGLEYFQKFFDKPVQRESNFGGCKYFFGKFYISLEVVPIKEMDVVGESGLK